MSFLSRLALCVGTVFVVLSSVSGCNLLFAYDADQLCETRVRALCRFAFTCCNANERLALAQADFLDANRYRNEGECVDDLVNREGLCLEGNAIKESIDEKRFKYDSALAKSCNEQLIAALNECDSEKVFDPGEREEDDECAEVVGGAYGEGLVSKGDACFHAYECEDPGSRCTIDPPNDPDTVQVTAVGECESPAEEGEDCSEDFFCEPGTVCNGTVCEELLDNGEACILDLQCKSGFCSTETAECDDPGVDDDVKYDIEACNGNDSDDTEF